MNKEAEKYETIHGKAVRHQKMKICEKIRKYEAFSRPQKEETERTSDSCSDLEKSSEKEIFSRYIGF